MTQFKDTSEAAVSAIRTILRLCELSGTVRRVIYTGSVTAASPLKEDDTGFKDSIDESCWTPLNLSYDFLKAYLTSKTLSEKELLMANEKAERGLEVVSLTCALVVGGLSYHTSYTTERGSNGVAADRQEVAPRESEVSAGSAGISTTRTHRGCLRSSCILHGEGVNVRQISVCRRLPNNARHRRSLR